VEGVFDGPAAQRVEETLAHARPGTRFRVDLTQVREFHDFGIAVLGLALARTPALVRLRGLREHHRRVMRYFGIETSRFDPELRPDPA
jgi:anti-anti-sigma regulatory factor